MTARWLKITVDQERATKLARLVQRGARHRGPASPRDPGERGKRWPATPPRDRMESRSSHATRSSSRTVLPTSTGRCRVGSRWRLVTGGAGIGKGPGLVETVERFEGGGTGPSARAYRWGWQRTLPLLRLPRRGVGRHPVAVSGVQAVEAVGVVVNLVEDAHAGEAGLGGVVAHGRGADDGAGGC